MSEPTDETITACRIKAARLEVKIVVEEWFSDVDLNDLFDFQGWSR